MIEPQVQSTGDGALVFDRALGLVPDVAWFDPAHWQAHGQAARASGGRGGVVFVTTAAGPCALRHYCRGGLVARLSRDRYAWFGAARTRSFREFHLLAELANAGLPVPAPVAARYVRQGLRYTADLLTRRIEAAQTLAALLGADRADRSSAERIGGMLARFHAAGVWHADLNAHNILVDAAGKAWLLDFDRGRRRRPSLAWQQANLARLRRSLDKLGARRMAGFDARFWHPLLAAYHAALVAAAEEGRP
ncbi:3-deoxy-D-manno-octulosonic acid kinase [Dokdonella sp.]|uniref:3-deoxy-D-manno-octulosonic acid kinase n=1 Tax=Dokdonella sp. TaxID=2291710 RepID=UPI0031BD4AF1|nr:3-deoxy-D-manno-octulosonic acid kinase [Dokdonella sp.]